MKKWNKWGIRTTVVALVSTCLLGGVVLAASSAGDKSDPLVSYSYFTQGILPALLEGVEEKSQGVADDLRVDFDDQIATYTQEVEELADQTLAAAGANGDMASASYAVVTLGAGETLKLEVGAEVMLRIGSATVGGGSPALINGTDGTELTDGGSLVKNNLYLCTMSGRTLTAGDSETWILVRQ